MQAARFVLVVGLAFPSAIQAGPGKEDRPLPKVVVTNPLSTDVVVSQRYPGQIRAQRHIDIRVLQEGYLEAIPVKEGQAVKKGEVLFQVAPALYKARFEAELGEVKLAQIEYENAKKLYEKKLISLDEVKVQEAKFSRAKAKANLAELELNFTTIRAPFDGLIGRFLQQEGSLVGKGDALTTLTDNSVMWVYFSITEARYLEYKRRQGKNANLSRLDLADARVELILADGTTFKHDAGNTITVEGRFNNDLGTITARADFPNPDRLLRHGQTGTVVISQPLKNVIVIPQRATFDLLDQRHVYVVDRDNVVRVREIVVEHELDDIFVVKKGLEVTDRIVLEGLRRVSDGDKVDPVFQKLEKATFKSDSKK